MHLLFSVTSVKMTPVRMSSFSTGITALLLTTLASSVSAGYFTNFTVNGNSFGAPCASSWLYNNGIYSSCVIFYHNTFWCSTTSNYTRDKKWGECLEYDVCQNHSILNDPWRNIAFDSASLPGGRKNDQSLREGWYQLAGVGGDSMVLYCSNTSSTPERSYLTSNYTSPISFPLYTCQSVYWTSSVRCVEQDIHSLDCGRGWYLYYLVKTNGLYATRHSNCMTSSCGEHAQCGLLYGSCACNLGLSIPDGYQPTGDSYGCTDLIIQQPAECKTTFTASCAEDFLNQLQNSNATVISQHVVTMYLKKIEDSIRVLKNTVERVKHGNSILKATKTLLFLLGKNNLTMKYGFLLQELEAQTTSLKNHSKLSTSQVSLDIAKTTYDSAVVPVILISYNTSFNFLSPDLFTTSNNTTKTMMSAVVSAPNINKTVTLFTLKHIQDLKQDSNITCVSWNTTAWTAQGCSPPQTNSSHSVCNCTQVSTAALIMETGPPKPLFQGSSGTVLLNEILNSNFTELPKETVIDILTTVMNTSLVNVSSENKVEQANNAILAMEKLVSALVTKVETFSATPITLPNLEIQVFALGPKASAKDIPPLTTSKAALNVDLFEIANKNNGSAALAFLSYTNVTNLLDPNLFNTTENTTKTMMSTVVSATLVKVTDKNLTKPVNFTLKHTANSQPNSYLTCVYWNNTEWIVDGCNLVETNCSHSVCSCDHLSTFALIMQSKETKNDHHLDLLNIVLASVGLVFLTLDLLTFTLCHQYLRVNSTPRINLCISLLLAHLLFLLTQKFLQSIRPFKLACAVLAGVQHFLFLSAFMWMLIEAVLLFISVKNLKKIRSKQQEVLDWKWLIIIGYVLPLVVVGVSVGLFPDGYGSEECWLKTDRDFVWSFLGPVGFILTANSALFGIIIFTLRSTLVGLNSDVSQIKEIKILVFKTLVQSAILGCPWILGFFTAGSQVLEIVFLFLNSQQGTFIFLVYCVFNQEVRQQYRKWMNACCPFSNKMLQKTS